MKLDEVLSVRLSAEEKQRVREAAARHGQSPSDFVRTAVLQHVDDPAFMPGPTITLNVTAPSIGANDERLLLRRLRQLIAQNGAAW